MAERRVPRARMIVATRIATALLCIAAATDAGAQGRANLFTGTDAAAADFGTGGGAGNTFPGAVVPFGMLQWSPDTIPSRVNYGGGYSYPETRIRGFSLTHLSGVGCPIMQDLPFLPTTVPVTASPAMPRSYDVAPAYVPTFSHRGERAEPGDYRVWLDRGTEKEIEVELTATTRAGLGRFRFAPTAIASVLINAGGSAMANGDAVLGIDPQRRTVSGWVESGQFCYNRQRYRVFFVAEFDRPFAAYGTWTKQAVTAGSTAASDHADDPFHLRPLSALPNPGSTSNGAQAGAYVTFDARRDRSVGVRVGISFVDVAGARANLAAEIPTWSLATVRRRARATWGALLDRIQLRGGRRADRRTFYTMLYHALLGPTVLSDADGRYPGMDGTVHVADGVTQYTTFSGWDIYRSQIALLAMLAPERVGDMMQSLVTDARESGWFPRWPVAGTHTNVMVGDPAAPIIAGAHAFGVTGFDRPAALAGLVKAATQPQTAPGLLYVERQGLGPYLVHGYVPHDGTEASAGQSTSMFGDARAVWGSAATTLEYTVADFALARLAVDLGDAATCASLAARADNWRRLYDPETGYVRPRYADGTFLTPFDPASLEGYAEGNAAQYTWMVPHAVGALADAMGGPAAAAARLDTFFTRLNAGTQAPFAYLSNEPGSATPYVYDWLGRPDRAQAVVRQALAELFNDSPAGYAGNDDVGQMSSWYVFGALGLHPAIPGTDVLAIGSPLFPKATLRLPGGTLAIRGRGAARDRPYVRRLTIDGREHNAPWITFGELRRGARLAFELDGAPSPSWGRDPADAPPSFGAGYRAVCEPAR